MKIRVDAERCSGHARCNVEAPDLFPLDEDGFNALRGKEASCPRELEEQAVRAEAICPERAITLER